MFTSKRFNVILQVFDNHERGREREREREREEMCDTIMSIITCNQL